MSHVSFFRNFNLPHAERSLDDTLTAISGGAWKTQIAILRQHHANDNKADFERCKKALPAFTPSGTFTGGRKLEHLTQYSGFIILDIDKITPVKVPLVKDFSKTSPYTYACFISPSGEGLKILVRVNATPETHKETYLQLQAHYENLLNLTIDKSGKDITRLCFVSYDPDTYINRDALLFNPVLSTTTKPTISTHQPVPSAKATLPKTPFDIYTDTVRFTCQKESYTEGNRNNFVYLLACNLNRNGISISDATDFIMRDYNFNDSEVRNAINSAYSTTYRQGMPCLSSKPCLSSTPNQKHPYKIKPNQEFDQDDSSFDDPLDEPKQERNITTNRFLLAQDYLNRHFEIRRNIVTQEYECRDLEKDEFLVMNENNIFIRMQVDGLNFSLPNLIALLKSEFIEDYNPFEEYFNNLPPWDGKTDYISFLTSFVHTADRQRFDLH